MTEVLLPAREDVWANPGNTLVLPGVDQAHVAFIFSKLSQLLSIGLCSHILH